MRRLLRPLAPLALICCGLASASEIPRAPIFEQTRLGPHLAWRTRTPGGEALVLSDGFVLRQGDSIRRFRWHSSLQLTSLVAERQLRFPTYRISGRAGEASETPQAERVRAVSHVRSLSIVYYVGARGLEFDIEIDPGGLLPELILESLDAPYSVDNSGNADVGGHPFALKPVTYTVKRSGQRQDVDARYRIDHPNTLRIDVGHYSPAEKLVIDPVLTYATYFAGSDEDQPVGLRELADGSVVFAGNTRSLDLQEGSSLNGPLMPETSLSAEWQCFVARISPETGRILFVSYFGGSRRTTCRSMDVDDSGAILLAGVGSGVGLTTPDAQHPLTRYSSDAFLARIAPNGKKVEYATFLNLSQCSLEALFMRSGAQETAYVATFCVPRDAPISVQRDSSYYFLLRYNLAAKRVDQKVQLTNYGELRGLERASSGEVVLFGDTQLRNLPMKDPVQPVPAGNRIAGFIAAYSSDLQFLLFSTYLGGDGGETSVHSVIPDSEGSIWVTGTSMERAIPGLTPTHPTGSFGRFVYGILLRPGNREFSKTFFAGGILNGFVQRAYGVIANGRHCVLTEGDVLEALPGGAAIGIDPRGRAALLVCLESGGNPEIITPIGSPEVQFTSFPAILVPSSRKGGLWFLQSTTSDVDAVPYEHKILAIQPYRPPPDPTGRWRTDLVLRHIDLATPRPELLYPQALQLLAVQGHITPTSALSGRNFALGMYLEVEDRKIPLRVSTPYSATLNYVPASTAGPFDVTLELRAGYYTGRLVVPAQPQPVASEPFLIVVRNLPPAPQPFLPAGRNPRLFIVNGPVYDDSVVLWNGQALPMVQIADGNPRVEVPAELAPPGVGEFVLINQRPGGGVERQRVRIAADQSVTLGAPSPTTTRLPAVAYQVDATRRLLYVISTEGASLWQLSVRSLPSAELQQTVSIPKDVGSVIVDFKLSPDGVYLYVLDSAVRIRRFRAESLEQDLQFQAAVDAPRQSRSLPETRHKMRVLADQPGSIVLGTPGGRLILYDGDRPRPYTSADFPTTAARVLEPLFAARDYVYAGPRSDVNSRREPCLIRYPIDALGFSPPENLCNPGASWGKYPEMNDYSGSLLLANTGGTIGIRPYLTSSTSMQTSRAYFPDRNLVAISSSHPSDGPQGRIWSYRIRFERMDGEEPLGHFPSGGIMDKFPNSIEVIDDETMIYLEDGGMLAIVHDWKSATEWYP